MEWWISITWWIIFYITNSRLFWVYLKKTCRKYYNPSRKINVNKKENRIIFQTKTGYCLELLAPETIKLLGRCENKITKDKNGEILPQLEIAEVVIVHCNTVNSNY